MKYKTKQKMSEEQILEGYSGYSLKKVDHGKIGCFKKNDSGVGLGVNHFQKSVRDRKIFWIFWKSVRDFFE